MKPNKTPPIFWNAIQLVFVSSLVLAASVVILSVGLLRSRAQAETHARVGQPTTDPDWSELIASMNKNAFGKLAKHKRLNCGASVDN